MTPPRNHRSARSLKQVLCTVHKIATLGDSAGIERVGDSLRSSPFNPYPPILRTSSAGAGAASLSLHCPPPELATQVNGNSDFCTTWDANSKCPPECLRRDPKRNRPAPVGLPAIQDGGIPLKGAYSSNDIEMHPMCRSAGTARTTVGAPSKSHAIDNPGCRRMQNATNCSEMNIGHIRNLLFYRTPALWHGHCLNRGCHGYHCKETERKSCTLN